jgi:hypothetical protein
MIVPENSAPTSSSPLAALMRRDAYAASRSTFFPNVNSVNWFIRRHRDALVERGALREIAGALWIHAERFDAAVLELAQPRPLRG